MVEALTRYGQLLFQPPADSIRGIKPEAWYSPLQPVRPIAPEGTEPRGFQYWAGQNLLWTPRADAEYTAAQLKQLATYPLARICIENTKDAVSQLPREIQVKTQPGETKKERAVRSQGDETIRKLNAFFDKPDREHDWGEWVRPLLEDMLVIDAGAILIRKTRAGEIVELPVMRGEMFVRYIDQNGFTPQPPEPAYAQNWWGIPLVNLSTDQLIYKPRNIVPRNTVASQLYGMSPTEQLAPEIVVGQKRLEFVTMYYTEGSIPGVVQVVPRGFPPDKLAEAMTWMNSELAGNLAARQQWRLVQGFADAAKGEKDIIEFAKQPLLADAYDELHLRKIAFGYGTSPQRLAKQMNRASAQQADEAAEVEGMRPWLNWLTGVINYIIQRKMGYVDYEIVFDVTNEPDPEKQGKTLGELVDKGLLTRNEGRDRLGEEPSPAPMADQLTVTTSAGPVPLGLVTNPLAEAGTATQGVDGKLKSEKKPGEAETPPNGNGGGAEKAWAHCVTHRKYLSTCAACGVAVYDQLELEKKAQAHPTSVAKEVAIRPGRLEPDSVLAKHRLAKVLVDRFRPMKRKTVRELAKRLKLPHKHLEGAAKGKLKKQDEADATQTILDALAADWEKVAAAAGEPLTGAALAGANLGGLQLDITSEDMLSSVSELAQAWAADRAAELVGMKVVGGKLVENPDARWAISDTTRDKLRGIIVDIFAEEDVTLADIEARIVAAGIFSAERATMIANTEIARAQTQGNLAAWRESGLVRLVDWQLSADHDLDDDCDDMADNGPYAVDEIDGPPLHPNCQCALVISDETPEEVAAASVEVEP